LFNKLKEKEDETSSINTRTGLSGVSQAPPRDHKKAQKGDPSLELPPIRPLDRNYQKILNPHTNKKE
jgi:hypothetical protein